MAVTEGQETPSEARAAYEPDFALWCLDQAALLRAGRTDGLDFEHLAEEIETLGRSQRTALRSNYMQVLLHLLKWRYQPGRRTVSWEVSIEGHRSHAESILENVPSLKSQKAAILREAYARARKRAAGQTGMLQSVFPEECPFAARDVERSGWLPPELAGADPVSVAVAAVDLDEFGAGDPGSADDRE